VRHALRPDEPWLTADAVSAVAEFLKPEHEAVEFGAARSTLWLARRCCRLVSVEHNAAWHAKVTSWLDAAQITNVDLQLRVDRTDYKRAIDDVSIVDFALIDGKRRAACAVFAAQKLRPGAMLVLDDADRYPTTASEMWARFHEMVADWPKGQHEDRVTRADIWLAPQSLR